MDKKTVSPLLSGLNPEQKKAVCHEQGPALILAGPGSGKTRALTSRIAFLIKERSIDPQHILAVTFTNKAAREMRLRLRTSCPTDACRKLAVCTFHAWGLALLKEHHALTGRSAQFNIAGDKDRHDILAGLFPGERGEIKKLAALFTACKQDRKTVKQINDTGLAEKLEKYQSFLKEHDLFDLDDLLYHPVLLLSSYPELLEHYRQKAQWLLIDEYQDINHAQYRLIRLLAPDPDSNLYAIGDPHQAIYGFRGADVTFINRFKEDYPSAAVYSFRQSYRCPQTILQASHNVLCFKSPSLLQGLEQGVKIKITSHASDKSEAESIARIIQQMMGGLSFFALDSKVSSGIKDAEIQSFSDFVILCRLKTQMPVIEKALTDHGIPFQTAGGPALFAEKNIELLISLLRLAYRKNNEFMKKKCAGLIKDRKADPGKISALIRNKTVSQALDTLIKTCLPADDFSQTLSCNRLMEISRIFGSDLEGFLELAELGTSADTYMPDTEQVGLMTLHAAKGLEFKCVFIAGCEQGLIPYSLFENQQADREEEKRLLYVGMTRAEKYLFLSHAAKRFLMGRIYSLKRSFFLDTIEQELIEQSRAEIKKKKKKSDDQMSLF